MDILKGKVAVVTGSTSGIGLAYARAFAGAGANIVLNGIEAPADVEKTRIAINSDFGVKAVTLMTFTMKPGSGSIVGARAVRMKSCLSIWDSL